MPLNTVQKPKLCFLFHKVLEASYAVFMILENSIIGEVSDETWRHIAMRTSRPSLNAFILYTPKKQRESFRQGATWDNVLYLVRCPSHMLYFVLFMIHKRIRNSWLCCKGKARPIPMLEHHTCHCEGVWVLGGKAACILDLGIRSK